MKLIASESSVMKASDKYGRYTVLGIFRAADGYQKYAKVKCQCGSGPRYVQVGTLRGGESQSCGCLHKERVSTHGMHASPIYRCWRAMHLRCSDPKDKRYARYGGRGIAVCEKWSNLDTFIADMGPTYRRGLTLDRIDNNGHYEPDNCRWATRTQQNRNYSRNILVTYNGKTKCLREWAEALNINYGTLWDRIKVQKLPPAIALSKKPL